VAAVSVDGEAASGPVDLFVPGRLCLFGEHSDWAGAYRAEDPRLTPGSCLVTGTDQGLHARIEPLADVFEVSSTLPDGARHGPTRVPFRVEELVAAARRRGFFSYAVGVAAEIATRFDVAGLRIDIVRTDLPIGKGLSSSAAVCVLAARAFNRVYQLGLTLDQEMELAYAGERLAGSACGRMDQICAYGRRTLLLTFGGSRPAIEPLAPGGTFWLLIVDLGAAKDTRRILADLNACYPATPGPLAARVRHALGPANAALVASARHAIEQGDARRLGALMVEAQARFDREIAPACPELVAPLLHRVLAHPAVGELAWGGKGVGSQGDGSAQLVARGAEERAALAVRLEQELGVGTLPLTLEPGASHAGTMP